MGGRKSWLLVGERKVGQKRSFLRQAKGACATRTGWFLLRLVGSFSPLGRLYQSCLDKGRTHTLIVPLQLPACSCFDQVLKERYLFVVGNLPFFVSNELIHQLQNPPPSFGYHH